MSGPRAETGHTADLILVNGEITTTAEATPGAGGAPAAVPDRVSGLAVRAGRVLAVGSDVDVRRYAGAATRVVDLGGRCVIPGLVDNHIHFVRAGLTWNAELRWERCPSLAAGLDTIAEAARSGPRDEWVLVIGGWNERQFPEGRGPTRAELDRVAPEHPVLVQMMYDWAQVNTAGMRAAGITVEEAHRAGAHLFEWDGDGRLTGRVLGMPGCKWLYARLPEQTPEQQVASTARLSRDLNRFAVTALIDGGGVNTGPDVYDAVYEADRRGELTVRTFLTVHASARGREREEIAGYLRYGRRRHGSETLRLLGFGEVVLYGLHDRVHTRVDVTDADRAELTELFTALATGGWPVQMHAHRPEVIETIIAACETVNARVPLAPLRWGIVHGEMIDAGQVGRIRAVGLGVLTQSLLRFLGDQMISAFGADRVRSAPPLRALLDAGVPVSAGTDAMRGASYDPFTSLHFYLTGQTIGGDRIVAPENLLNRTEALRLYTRGSAWNCFAEHEIGALLPGFRADLAVLSDDYLTVDVDRIPTLESELTLLGGRPVHLSGDFAAGPLAADPTSEESR
ncbi:amidohydrolase [Solwaraspora sp. WMMD1047]|uniref:amidohydrolase n=1 Tax=Solwaraspora sp. WMMD1047 TaxID=3016102 RepID=UPI0024166A99|nr:amidohydrolase [Solwaraspora sp. WMMD1047]MDG4830571.1 amidohydrolase [Solwaraspora sp. WMMD1047]